MMKKSNTHQSTIIEKIEILDESTGEIILKERPKEIGLDLQVLIILSLN